MEIIKVVPRGYCKGVTRAIAQAKETVKKYPNKPIYVLGMLVHNTYVMKALEELHIHTIDQKNKTRLELLDEIPSGSVVIFTAHGVANTVKEKAQNANLICIDASCPDVLKTQDIVLKHLADGYVIFYVGKQQHPEAEAVCSLSDKIHLISDIHTIPNLSVDKVFVTNQTTMSIFDIENIFNKIREQYPNACFSEEICNATRIRQEAVAALKEQEIDVLYVVGDRHSNNSNRLAQIANEIGIEQVYLIDDVTNIELQQVNKAKRVAVTSGASTPTYLTTQVIHYLENLENTPIKPSIDITKIL